VVIAPCTGPGASSFVVVLDAGSWQEVARVELPFVSPNRFHGQWLPA
jgi:carotenoid cleavage dioxygenase-like enzyme